MRILLPCKQFIDQVRIFLIYLYEKQKVQLGAFSVKVTLANVGITKLAMPHSHGSTTPTIMYCPARTALLTINRLDIIPIQVNKPFSVNPIIDIAKWHRPIGLMTYMHIT